MKFSVGDIGMNEIDLGFCRYGVRDLVEEIDTKYKK